MLLDDLYPHDAVPITDIRRTKLRVEKLKKKTLILRKEHLNNSGMRKLESSDLSQLGFADFRVYAMSFQFANKVLFLHKGRIRVLKERNPTSWSIAKKLNVPVYKVDLNKKWGSVRTQGLN